MYQQQENFELRPIQNLKQIHFFIPDYQRGYKWDVQQVLDLLQDIDNFDAHNEPFYCLQPLVVSLLDDEKIAEREIKLTTTEINQKNYEVIDGQQRLTTIHIILEILDQGLYTIEYQTRERSQRLLKHINETDYFGAYSITYQKTVKGLQEAINQAWNDFVKDKVSAYNNIDFYHFFTAYLTAKAWFTQKSEVEKTYFKTKLLENTKFIWYNETHEEDPKKVFRNLNSGKIPLTNAELIKALFINHLKNDNKEVQQLQQTTLATEWDNIEIALQEDEFWFFINNETKKSRYQTRIDFLFELLTKKRPDKNADKLYTYRQYANRTVQLDWNVVKQLFLTLKEWFENRRWYHLIGFIVDRNISSIRAIRQDIARQKIGKKAFEQYLIRLIQQTFAKTKKIENKDILIYDLDNLEYETKAHHAPITTLLLLHNIETYQKSVAGFRFPFYKFKNTKWSLEHIHAQNAKQTDETTDNEIDTTLHHIQNLALLDGKTNASLSNNTFEEKRKTILTTIQKGENYIPICTKNVFLKYYSSNIDKMNFWTTTDQQDYLTNIKTTLSIYLPKNTTKND